MTPILSFHLVRYPTRRVPVALARAAWHRRALRGVPGLELARVLGTGSGESTAGGADLRRWALFARWSDPADLDAFTRRWRGWSGADEVWGVRLRPTGGHGSWRGAPVLAGVATAPAGAAGGPVAVVTRAWVRPRHWRRFAVAGRAVDDELRGRDGLLARVGVGEAPLGLLGTFSLWRSAGDLDAFAAGAHAAAHRAVVTRTRAERWYGEELFARFEPVASEGTWDGRDPLAGLSAG